MAVPATEAHVHHLLTRAAWIATDTDVETAMSEGIESTVARVLDAPAPEAGTPPRFNAGDEEIIYAPEVIVQWFLELCTTSSAPALERLTWFWHGHFATHVEKVEFPSLMLDQLKELRAHALGDFAQMVLAMTFDPAMTIWLDLETNVVGQPNENYARELLELFTMGIDNGYTQRDIVEVARAMTGVGLGWPERDEGLPTGEFHGNTHDKKPKTILGSTANHGPESAIEVIVRRPETAEFVVRRLWYRYAGTVITAAASADMVAAFGPQLSIREAVGTMLTHPDFYDDTVRGGLVAAPVESIVRAYRGFGLPVRVTCGDDEECDVDTIVELAEIIGQQPIHPPHVGGWPHNEAWLDLTGSQRRVIAGRVLAERLLEDPTPAAERVINARTNLQLHDGLAAGFGVRRWSDQTAAALDDTARIASTEQRITAAVAVAFTSPEVTLS
ncbi:MAG: DUF1800 domain-containing protein [Actinomycetia bacterium]|nr:DUF1800 domain-containing protein [Actinomycetes bacterium]